MRHFSIHNLPRSEFVCFSIPFYNKDENNFLFHFDV